MSETYCGLLNVLILGILAATNGLQLRRQREVKEELQQHRNGSSDT